MNDLLKFSLEEMQTVLEQARKYQASYANAINSLETEIAELGSNWTSRETGTYEAFKAKYDEKIVSLKNANDMMIEFCNQISSKIAEFEDATSAAKNLFL